MASSLRLDRLQRWMHAVVVHPGSEGAAVAAPEAEYEISSPRIGEVLLPSRTLTPVERIGIYHGMYLLRMRDALASDYEALQHFLGDEGFTELVRGYVEAYPSRSYSLNPLGDHLPEYLKNAPGVRSRGFCIDLARLELAVQRVFDAEETPAHTNDRIASVPSDEWETARLCTVAAFELLAFRYPVNAYLQSVRDDEHDHPKPRREDTWVAVYRRGYKVWRLDLSRAAHDLLADLAAGIPLGPAVNTALERGGRHAPKQDDLFRWFREWASGGVFSAVETS